MNTKIHARLRKRSVRAERYRESEWFKVAFAIGNCCREFDDQRQLNFTPRPSKYSIFKIETRSKNNAKPIARQFMSNLLAYRSMYRLLASSLNGFVPLRKHFHCLTIPFHLRSCGLSGDWPMRKSPTLRCNDSCRVLTRLS